MHPKIQATITINFVEEKRTEMNHKNTLRSISLAAAIMVCSAAGRPAATTTIVEESPFGNQHWTMQAASIQPAIDLNADGKLDTDLMILIRPCERDDADLFRADGFIITHRGATSCEEDEGKVEETGTWAYNPSTKTLIMERYDGSKPIEGKLETITPNKITFVSTHQSSKGKHTIRTTYVAKKV
ncbi:MULTISPECIES: hypothetical protein [Olivibacter]|jgi:hypothetical protein|uniref:Lipocalin-like domain-containing protein n=2 Tax=Olivibacter TaxID=376469 RepID=A0ABV6HK00_9SPHI|nr:MULTISPECIES: hypothetical protein [Olivibacter]MCL4642122.1 hypothetical protein [Olivibacter sp. UJ_SKK_5.1]MDM8175061.1 hypothetical protein [Olivibacter sp. 47]MDX3913254.1 hypothetical protein [Pseudosphingobacterium sp.]QEL01842.1 hypothetical protein FKG96_13855 [Olivibacter sp. LS-1]